MPSGSDASGYRLETPDERLGDLCNRRINGGAFHRRWDEDEPLYAQIGIAAGRIPIPPTPRRKADFLLGQLSRAPVKPRRPPPLPPSPFPLLANPIPTAPPPSPL